MGHIVIEQLGIGVLSANTLPEAVGGGANPFKDAIEFLDKTRGRWWHQNEVAKYGAKRDTYGNGRGWFKALIAEASGVQPADSVTPIYMSPYFDSWELALENLPSAFTLFGAMGLFIEVIDYPVYVTIPDANYNDAVPSYLPGATYIDENEVEQNRTWVEWKKPNSFHSDPGDGNKYVPLASITGKHLAGSIIVQLIGDGFAVGYQKDMPQPEAAPE